MATPQLPSGTRVQVAQLSTQPQLHIDAWKLIFGHLSGLTWPTLRRVCKIWRRAVDEEAYHLRVAVPFCEKLTVLFSGMCVLHPSSAYLEWDRMIKFLSTLPRLASLELAATPQHCLSDLRALPNLRHLQLTDFQDELFHRLQPDEKLFRTVGLEASPLTAMPLLSLSNMGLGPLLGSFALDHCTCLQLLHAADIQRSICAMQSLRELDLRDLDFVPHQGLQGTVSLPHLTGLFLYTARFAMLSLNCPSLQLLSLYAELEVQPEQVASELRYLTQLTQLDALHLSYIQNVFLDLRPLEKLKVLSLDHSDLPRLPASLVRLDWCSVVESQLLTGLSQLSNLETLTLGFFSASQKEQLCRTLRSLCSLTALKFLGVEGEDLSTDMVPLTLSRLSCIDLEFAFEKQCCSPINSLSQPSPCTHHLLHWPSLHH